MPLSIIVDTQYVRSVAVAAYTDSMEAHDLPW